MSASLDHVDMVVARTPERIDQQAVRVATLVWAGENTRAAEGILKTLECDLLVYTQSRQALAEACRSLDENWGL